VFQNVPEVHCSGIEMANYQAHLETAAAALLLM
jgi:hypothetical protein